MLELVNKIIAIDICNTLADIITEIEVRLGHNPNPTEYFHPGINKYPRFFEDNLDVFLNAKAIGDSALQLRELSKNNTIVYLTARPQIAEFVTRLWLKNNGYPIAPIYFTNNKVRVASKLGVNLAIEDAPFELDRYMEADIEVLVKQQSYNLMYSNRFDWNSSLGKGEVLITNANNSRR